MSQRPPLRGLGDGTHLGYDGHNPEQLPFQPADSYTGGLYKLLFEEGVLLFNNINNQPLKLQSRERIPDLNFVDLKI